MNIFENKPELNAPYGGLIPAEKILVIAPHPDDEVLGCGGTLHRYCLTNTRIRIIYLSTGTEEDSHTRKREAQQLPHFLPGIEQQFYEIHDSRFYHYHSLIVELLDRELNTFCPQIIFTPWFLDTHPDHQCTNQCLSRSIQIINCPLLIACYETFHPLVGNHSINITGIFPTKKRMLSIYKSQLEQYPLIKIISHLNIFRGAVFPRNSFKIMESFFVTNSVHFNQFIHYFYRGELCNDSNRDNKRSKKDY